MLWLLILKILKQFYQECGKIHIMEVLKKLDAMD